MVDKVGAATYDYTAIAEEGDGLDTAKDAGSCGVNGIVTITVPDMEVHGANKTVCAFALSQSNITGSGTATATAIKVGTHPAYLPSAVHDYLNDAGGLNLGLPQTALTVSTRRFANGDMTITESAPLVRCSGGDAFPPTAVTCPTLVSTGVRFLRVVNLFRGAHQARLRDTFVSADGHWHSVSAQYQAGPQSQATGAVGYTFPNHGSTFTASALNQKVTGLGTKAGTLFIRSDMYASGDDRTNHTIGLTWSKAPSSVQFSATDANLFAMPYSFTVPAGGKTYLGFAVSEKVTTTAARALAGVAQREMVKAPSIGSPKNGAVIKGHLTTVKGAVTLGANGLPTKVLVNGHTAKLARVSATKATYTVSFRLSFGRHRITVTARDSAGNGKSRSIRVKNVAP
jgi:hypothetical protein